MKFKIPKIELSINSSAVNVVPYKYYPYLIDMNSVCARINSNILRGRKREIDRIYNCLLKSNNANVVLLGEHGVGKTATVQMVIENVLKKRCPKEMRNYHFLYLDIEQILPKLSNKSIQRKLESIINFISSYNNFVVVIDQVHLVQADELLSYYFSLLVKQAHVKILGMSTEEEFYMYFELDKKARASIEIIPILEPKAKKIYPMITDVVKEFEKNYGVTITEDMVNYIISVSGAFDSEMYNPGLTMNFVEKSMIVAKRRNEKEVSRKSVNSNFNFNYELYRQMSKEDKECTAYHEAGHFIVQKLSGNIRNYRTTAITIVPAEYFLGVTLFDFEYEKQISMDMDYYIDLIAIDLAGIAAEKIYYGSDSKFSSGGSADFEHATETARALITSYGMVKECGENMAYLGNPDLISLSLLSEEIKNNIDVKTKELIVKAEERAKNILDNNRLLLDKIAEGLIENEVLDEKDLDRICKEVEEEKKSGEKLYKELMEEPD